MVYIIHQTGIQNVFVAVRYHESVIGSSCPKVVNLPRSCGACVRLIWPSVSHCEVQAHWQQSHNGAASLSSVSSGAGPRDLARDWEVMEIYWVHVRSACEFHLCSLLNSPWASTSLMGRSPFQSSLLPQLLCPHRGALNGPIIYLPGTTLPTSLSRCSRELLLEWPVCHHCLIEFIPLGRASLPSLS